jgi:hypothetical protein
MRNLSVVRAVRLPIVLAALLVWLTAVPAADAKRTVPQGFYGTIMTGPIEEASNETRGRAWDALALAGVESVRTTFYWGLAQPQPGDAFKWERTDKIVADAATRRITLMPTLLGPPYWARQYPDVAQSPPRDTAGFAAWVKAAVNRYGPKGSFWEENPYLPRTPIRHWQVWNEPELSDHWWRGDGNPRWGRAHAKAYGDLVRATRRAVREADPGGKIVLAGLTNSSWETLAALFRNGGIRGQFDIAAVHMFPGNWRNVSVIVDRFRKALNKGGAKRTPIWVTEMTWPASKGRATVPPWADTPYYRNFVTTEKGAASRLTAAYKLLANRSFRSRYRLERVNWYSGISTYREDYLWNYVGLLEFGNLRQTPAYRAFQASARKHQGCTKDATGACR